MQWYEIELLGLGATQFPKSLLAFLPDYSMGDATSTTIIILIFFLKKSIFIGEMEGQRMPGRRLTGAQLSPVDFKALRAFVETPKSLVSLGDEQVQTPSSGRSDQPCLGI